MIPLLFSAVLAFAAPGGVENMLLCQSPGIIDGDTFRCDGALKVRLWGVDAPERDAPGGLGATRALADLTQGQLVVCKRRGKSYDRVVAQCWVGRRDIAGALVRAGHARDWPKFSRGYYAGASAGRPSP